MARKSKRLTNAQFERRIKILNIVVPALVAIATTSATLWITSRPPQIKIEGHLHLFADRGSSPESMLRQHRSGLTARQPADQPDDKDAAATNEARAASVAPSLDDLRGEIERLGTKINESRQQLKTMPADAKRQALAKELERLNAAYELQIVSSEQMQLESPLTNNPSRIEPGDTDIWPFTVTKGDSVVLLLDNALTGRSVRWASPFAVVGAVFGLLSGTLAAWAISSTIRRSRVEHHEGIASGSAVY